MKRYPFMSLQTLLLVTLSGCATSGGEQAGAESSRLGASERTRLHDAGLRFLEAGQFEEAIRSFDQALVLHPTQQEVYRAKSRALDGLGREVEAISTRARAEHVWLAARTIEMYPEDAAAWFNLGVMFTGGGNGEPALTCFRRADELEPNNAEYLFHYAWYLGDQGYLKESLLAFQQAIALNPEPRYYDRLGRILGDAGRIDDSIRAFDRAAELDPDAPPSINRAVLLVSWGRFEEAVPLLEGITEVTPGAHVAQRELGWCLHHMGRFDEALSRYDLAASVNAYGRPIEPWSSSTGKKCWLYRGTTYAAMGRLEEALADLTLFAEARQDYPGIEETIEQIKIQLGEL